MLLLDTCTLLWLTGDPARLSPVAESAMREYRHQLYVSCVSGFELAQKVAKGKLILPLSTPEWVNLSLRTYGLQSLSLSMEAAILAGGLERLHDDPFDRLLIASAQEHGLTLVTPDPKIRQYPAPLQTLW